MLQFRFLLFVRFVENFFFIQIYRNFQLEPPAALLFFTHKIQTTIANDDASTFNVKNLRHY